MTDSNGRIRLSWAQVTWGVAVLVAILASWYDQRAQITILRHDLSAIQAQGQIENMRIWQAIGVVQEAQAAAREKPKPRAAR